MLEFACVGVIFNEVSDEVFTCGEPTGIHCTCDTLQSTQVSFLLNPHLFFR